MRQVVWVAQRIERAREELQGQQLTAEQVVWSSAIRNGLAGVPLNLWTRSSS